MENHTFGEPVPVVHYPTSSNNSDVISSDQPQEVEPSWTVDVIRKGSNVVVGTIVINNTKLPPRRNKNKKLVWKLPTTSTSTSTSSNKNTEDDMPRFGKQDYPRLWEIYKEEKKKRRSLQKTTGTSISSNNSIDDDISSNNNNIDNNNIDNNRDMKRDSHAFIDHENIPDPKGGINKAGGGHKVQHPDQTVSTPNQMFIAPPPGFEATTTSTTGTTPIVDHHTSCDPLDRDAVVATSISTTATIRPPPGFS